MKKMRGWLLAVLCLITAFGSLTPVSRAADTGDIANGDVVKIGSYPQSRVTDTSLISRLNSAGKVFRAYPYYSKNPDYNGPTYPTRLDKTMMDYADFTYSGVKYRAVRINKWRPSDVTHIADNVSDSKQQINGYTKGTVYYFVWEPIRWIVLDKSNGIVMSQMVLDAQPFNAFFENTGSRYMSAQDSESSASAWHYSTVRLWLNGDGDYYEDYSTFNFLYSAFTSSEQSAIKSMLRSYSVELKQYSSYDKVFLPTEAEFIQYKSRITSAENTAYAESQGKSRPGSSGGNYWYTIKAANDKKMYYCVDQTMSYSDDSYSNITSTITGIRPMLKLDLSSDAVIGPFTIRDGGWVSRTPFLTWDAQDDALSYDIYRCPGNVDPATTTAWTKLTTTPLDGTAEYYSDKTAVTETAYYYYAAKHTSYGTENSKPVRSCCRLGTTTLTVGNNQDGRPLLSWDAVNKADGYLVYRKLVMSGGYTPSWVLLTESPITTLNYTDTTATPGFEYGYWVRSWSSLGEDFYSVNLMLGSGTKGYCKLGRPTPDITTWPNGKPRIEWPRVTGDDGSGDVYYTVYYRWGTQSGWSSWTEAASTSGTGFTHAQASDVYSCQYYVKASFNNKDSVYDSTDSVILNWKAAGEKAVVDSCSLELEGKIGIRLNLSISESASKAVLRYEGEFPKTVEWDLVRDKAHGYSSSTGQFTLTYRNIAAKELTCPLSVTVYKADGTALTMTRKTAIGGVSGKTYSCHAADWAAYAAVNGSEKTARLAKTLLNYGGSAQKYFKFNLTNPANPQNYLASETVSVTPDSSLNAVIPSNAESKLGYKSMALNLEGDTELRLTFTKQVTAVDGNGKKLTVKKSGSNYYVSLPGIAAVDLDRMQTVKVTYGSSTGTFKAAALSYANKAIQNSSNADLVKTMKALYLYNQAAKAYFK